MNVTCRDCLRVYDDAERWTYCPHERFMSVETLKQKDLGLSLLGKWVRFRHQKPDSSLFLVMAVNWEGMVSLNEMAGEFHPDLFVPIDLQEG